MNQKWSSLLKNVIKKGKISGKKEKISQCVAYAVLISLEYVENCSGNTRFWFINKNKLQWWKKAMTVYICKTPNKYLLLEYNFDKRTNIGNCSNIFCTCQVSNSANAYVTM